MAPHTRACLLKAVGWHPALRPEPLELPRSKLGGATRLAHVRSAPTSIKAWPLLKCTDKHHRLSVDHASRHALLRSVGSVVVLHFRGVCKRSRRGDVLAAAWERTLDSGGGRDCRFCSFCSRLQADATTVYPSGESVWAGLHGDARRRGVGAVGFCLVAINGLREDTADTGGRAASATQRHLAGMPTARREAVREFQREASSWVLRLTLACLPEGCTFPREVNCAQGDFRRG